MSGYPLAHKIDMRHKYVPSDKTDIRKTFAKARNAANSNQPVLVWPTLQNGTEARGESEFSRAECF